MANEMSKQADTLRFQTLSITTARIVALCTLAVGLGVASYCLYKLSQGNYFIGVTGTLLAMIFVVIGFIGPATVQLHSDQLIIRSGVWKTPVVFPLSDIKELHFDTNKKGRVFVIRTKTEEQTMQFNQHALVVAEFANQLEKLKVRVSGKR